MRKFDGAISRKLWIIFLFVFFNYPSGTTETKEQ